MPTNVIGRLEAIKRLRLNLPVFPSFVFFHTSDFCNQRCLGCAYKHSGTYLDRDRHFRAVDIFTDVGVKAFDFAGGGDPTAIPYLAQLLEYIAMKGAAFGLLTNGTMMSDRLTGVLVDHGAYVRISLEASCREEYASYKGIPQDRWDTVLGNISRLVLERNKAKSKLEISIKFAASKTLRGAIHYRRALDLGNLLHVDNVQIKALRHEPEELPISERLFEQELCDIVIGRTHGHFPRVKSWIAPVPFDKVPQCWLNPLHTGIDHLGNLYLCCYYYYREQEHKIGNIFEQEFRDIWMSDRHKRLIAMIDRNKCDMVDCKFFHHHASVEEFFTRNRGYFL